MSLSKSLKFKLFLSIKSLKRRYSWHKGVKTFRLFTGSMINIVRLIADRLNTNHVMAVFVMFGALEKLRQTNGLGYVAKYLKACNIYVMQYVATNNKSQLINSNSYDIHVSITHSGIPRILPIYWRTLLRAKDPTTIRIILTVCNLYRVLPFPGKVKLSTITDPFVGEVSKDMLSFIPLFWKMLNSKSFSFVWIPNVISTSGSITNGKRMNSTSGFILALASLKRDSALWESISWFFNVAPQRRGWKARNANAWDHLAKLADNLHWTGLPSLPLGKLAFKDEPGKVRVFAMVDCITQWVLKPIHDWIFGILREIPTDATFDQDRGVEEIREQILAFDKPKWIYSLDLSAATDKLPVLLQKAILNHVITGFGDVWCNLLCNRDYVISKTDCSKYRIDSSKAKLRYGTGQPMGAYSSWAMLALTHHFIVQYCASRCGREVWFTEYMVLGDDIIILDSKVAKMYLKVMRDLDVGINLSKSLISNNGCAEFAKKLVTPLGRVEGVSLKEFSSLGNSFSNIINLAAKFAARPVNILRILGYGSLSSGHAVPSFMRMSLKSVIHHILISPVILQERNWYQWFAFVSHKWHDDLERGRAYAFYILWTLEYKKYKFCCQLGRKIANRVPSNVSERVNSLVRFWFPDSSGIDHLYYFPKPGFDKHRLLPLPSKSQAIMWMSSTIHEIFKNSALLTSLTDGGDPGLTMKCMNWELSFEDPGFSAFELIDNSIIPKVLTRNPKAWVNLPALEDDFFDVASIMSQQEAEDGFHPCRLADISKFLDIKRMLVNKLYRARNILYFDVPTMRYPRLFDTKRK